MSRGHGIIASKTSDTYLPFIFQYNPTSITTEKKINYAVAPNIGGAFKKKYFSGFDTKEINFQLVCVDKISSTGVMSEISFFEHLREPDPGLDMPIGLTYGNVNYPPPQVLFQFGVGYAPLFWDVLNVSITEDHFHSGHVRGVLGYPKMATIDITLSLIEDHNFNKANQIAKKAATIIAFQKNLIREGAHKVSNTRKENPGFAIKISEDW